MGTIFLFNLIGVEVTVVFSLVISWEYFVTLFIIVIPSSFFYSDRGVEADI